MNHVFCTIATPFTPSGALDQAALRMSLQRMVDAKIGVYLGGANAGEGHALTAEEAVTVYRIGVEVCRNQVAVRAHPPELPTARASREQLLAALDSGLDLVTLYGPAGRHGYKPTDAELIAYYDAVLPAVKRPVALSSDPLVGHVPGVDMIARLCEKYSQIAAIELGEQNESYLINLKRALKSDVALYVPLAGSLNALNLGATGVISAEANIIPLTVRDYVATCLAGDDPQAATAAYKDIRKFMQYVAKWAPSSARWIKLCMRALGLPGGAGGVREPYLLPGEDECRTFAAGLSKLGLAEIDAQARNVGLSARA